jgi:uncharacterized repeat protein (TIGR01451 family)
MTDTHTVETRRRPIRLIQLGVVPLLVLGLAASAAAQPTLTKTFSSSTIGPGSTSTATFVIDNSSGMSTVTNIGFTDTLPANVVVATPGSGATSCTDGVVTAASGASTITLAGARLGAGVTCTVTVNVTSRAVRSALTPTLPLP